MPLTQHNIYSWIIRRLGYKASIRDKLLFFGILSLELLFLPFLLLNEELKKALSYMRIQVRGKIRGPLTSNEIIVCLHEWAGYDLVREKHIRDDIRPFECGLGYQLSRIEMCKKTHNVKLMVTVSERTKYDYKLPEKIDFMDVPAQGFDFAGYAAFFRKYVENDELNRIVILTNSSVEKSIDSFLKDYIHILKQNPDIGFLGISYNTRVYQSLVRNNFTPHISSFFIMTTSDVLREVFIKNKRRFPGEGITHKLLLIRRGEVKLSRLVLKLGYKIAFVLNDGCLHTYGPVSYINNGFATWNLPHGDYRISATSPNRINRLN